MTDFEWFTPDEPQETTFWAPGVADIVAELAEREVPQEEIDAYIAKNSFTAKQRELTGADNTTLTELAMDESGVRINPIQMQLATIVVSLVEWSLPRDISLEAVQALPEATQNELFRAVPHRKLTLADYDAKGRANGSGPPTSEQTLVLAPQDAHSKDAATSS